MRGLAFELTAADFLRFWRQPCHYCGYRIRTVGIDRVDNSRGYVRGNVVSACFLCNRAKSSLTKAQFVALCSNVVRRHGLTYAAV